VPTGGGEASNAHAHVVMSLRISPEVGVRAMYVCVRACVRADMGNGEDGCAKRHLDLCKAGLLRMKMVR